MWVNDLNLLFNRFDQTPNPHYPPWHSPQPSHRCCPHHLFLLPFLLPHSHHYLPFHFCHVADNPHYPPTFTHLPHLKLRPLAPMCPSPQSRWEISWGRWRWRRLQVQAHQILCRSAVLWNSCGIYLQHEPEAGKSATAVENLLRSTCTKDPSPKRLKQLQTSCCHFTPDEDPGRAGPRPSLPSGGSFLDPPQFAYQTSIGVDTTAIFLLDRSLSHLKKPGSTVRIMSFDFSSAFNTIQPALLGDKQRSQG